MKRRMILFLVPLFLTPHATRAQEQPEKNQEAASPPTPVPDSDPIFQPVSRLATPWEEYRNARDTHLLGVKNNPTKSAATQAAEQRAKQASEGSCSTTPGVHHEKSGSWILIGLLASLFVRNRRRTQANN